MRRVEGGVRCPNASRLLFPLSLQQVLSWRQPVGREPAWDLCDWDGDNLQTSVWGPGEDGFAKCWTGIVLVSAWWLQDSSDSSQTGGSDYTNDEVTTTFNSCDNETMVNNVDDEMILFIGCWMTVKDDGMQWRFQEGSDYHHQNPGMKKCCCRKRAGK